jgi:hypothetical protein
MSDMPRPASFPSAPDHERHDALLVAQFVAGDELDERQRHDAQRLLSMCAACAELAADLRTVASVVAWEPVPPRRRDNRISAEQAEHLRGNAITRLLRGLSLPRARAFQPAAAGLMSVGLLFVVAGYAWPGDEAGYVASESLIAPAAVESDAARTFAPLEVTPPAPAGLAADEAEQFVAEPGADSADRVTAQQKSLESRAMSADDSDQGVSEALAGAPAEPLVEGMAESTSESAESLPEPPDGRSSLGDTQDAVGPNATGLGTEALVEEGADYFSDVEALQRGAGFRELDAADVAAGSADPELLAEVPLDDGLDVASLLLVGGVGLLLAGGLLLAMAWLARRARDPLLR